MQIYVFILKKVGYALLGHGLIGHKNDHVTYASDTCVPVVIDLLR